MFHPSQAAVGNEGLGGTKKKKIGAHEADMGTLPLNKLDRGDTRLAERSKESGFIVCVCSVGNDCEMPCARLLALFPALIRENFVCPRYSSKRDIVHNNEQDEWIKKKRTKVPKTL